MAGADGDRQRVTTRLGDEFLNLFRTRIGRIFRGDDDLILNAREGSKLCLDDNAVVMRIFHDLTRDGDVLGERLAAHVDHDGSEAAVNAALAELKAVTVVKMQADRQAGVRDCSLDKLDEIGVVGVAARALGNLKDQRSVAFLGGLRDALDDLHVIDVKCADGVTAVVGFLKHFFGSYERHTVIHLLSELYRFDCVLP